MRRAGLSQHLGVPGRPRAQRFAHLLPGGFDRCLGLLMGLMRVVGVGGCLRRRGNRFDMIAFGLCQRLRLGAHCADVVAARGHPAVDTGGETIGLVICCGPVDPRFLRLVRHAAEQP